MPWQAEGNTRQSPSCAWTEPHALSSGQGQAGDLRLTKHSANEVKLWRAHGRRNLLSDSEDSLGPLLSLHTAGKAFWQRALVLWLGSAPHGCDLHPPLLKAFWCLWQDTRVPCSGWISRVFFSVHLPDVAAFTMRTVMDVFGSAASTFISFLIETLGGLLGQWVTAGVTLCSWNSPGSFPCRTGVTVPPRAWPSPRALQLLYRGKISKRGKNLGRQTCKGISRLNRKCWRAEKSLGLVLGLVQIHWAGASRHVKVYMQKFTLILRKQRETSLLKLLLANRKEYGKGIIAGAKSKKMGQILSG